MIYTSSQDWRASAHRKVALFGMSGLGKTYISNMLRAEGAWFHYSVDYRIGTRYMGEHIVDNFKREAMKSPLLQELLRSDSIYIASNITFENLAPLSTYLGKPGDPARGGISMAEYQRRQAQHRKAEIAALLDTEKFIAKAREIYGYAHFICDTGGSICEVVEPQDPNDPVLRALSEQLLLVWIKGDDAHSDELARRFDRDPKPMYYRPQDLLAFHAAYLARFPGDAEKIDPDAFIRFSFRQVLKSRQERYAAMAKWGITLEANDVAAIRDSQDFETLIADALARR